MRAAQWVVYAKAPFAGPQQVLDYVGRYTHRVAISNNRLLDIDGASPIPVGSETTADWSAQSWDRKIGTKNCPQSTDQSNQ